MTRPFSLACYRVRQAIKTLEAQLDPARFARAHRSAIVKLERVRTLEPMPAGEYVITLSTGERCRSAAVVAIAFANSSKEAVGNACRGAERLRA